MGILVEWPYNFWNDTIADAEMIILNDDRFGYFPWIYNFDRLFPGSLIWRFDLALDIAQRVQYQDVNDTIKEIVELKLKHYFDDVPYPKEIFVSKWTKNKYVQGAYSNWPVGFDNDSKEAMGWPLSQTLFFAGEAMSDFDYGYVHSAYLSGIDTANTILSCMGNDNGLECPSEYMPSSDSDNCSASMNDESIFKDLILLWIVIGVLLGIVLSYLFAKYCSKINKNQNDGSYGSIKDAD